MQKPYENFPIRQTQWSLILFFVLFFIHLGQSQSRTLSRQLIFEKMGRHNTNVFLEDSYGFIWIGGDSLYRYDGHTIRPYLWEKEDGELVFTGKVNALYEDTRHRIWVGADQGLFRYDKTTDQYHRYLVNSATYQKDGGQVLSIYEDDLKRIWVGTTAHLYVLENPDVDDYRIIEGIKLEEKHQDIVGFTFLTSGNPGEILAASSDGLWLITADLTAHLKIPYKWQGVPFGFQINDAANDGTEGLWLATTDGLWHYNIARDSLIHKDLPAEVGRIIVKVMVGQENEVWIGTATRGLFKLKNGAVTQFTNDPDNLYSIIDNRIRALMFDRFNNLWIGTLFGINLINFEQQRFPFYQIDPGPYRNDNYTFRILEDSLGGFWFRLTRLGLGYSAGLGRKFEVLLRPKQGSQGEEVKNFCADPDGNVWVTTLTQGLYKFPRGQKLYLHPELGDSMKLAYTYVILSDRVNGRYLWFSSRFGLCRVDRFTYQRKWFSPTDDLPVIDSDIIGAFEQAEDGNFWCPVRYRGNRRMVYFDYEKQKFVAEFERSGHPSSKLIKRRTIRHIKSIPGNKIWVGTDNGLLIIDATRKTYRHLTTKMDLPVGKVRNISPDLDGNVWFTGLHQICKFDGAEYLCFDAQDDIEAFTYWSATLGKDGRITFGGKNGIYSFYPDEITFAKDTIPPKVCLTDLQVFNQKHRIGKATELLRKISLPFEDKVITFEFAALHFLRPDRIRYRRRLAGADKDWVETSSSDRKADYSYLSPGRYTFQVQAAIAGKAWSSEAEMLSVQLIILPPWYRTWWAYGLYIMGIGLILYTIRRYELRRQFARSEAQRLQELDSVKSQLYTNITHEFRTPLTVILGMADQVKKYPGEWLDEGTQLIGRNGQRLLRLIDQLLDLSKLESGVLPQRQLQGDIIAFLRYVFESFQSFAESRGVSLQLQSGLEEYPMDYDPENLQKIVSNLLSNAVKYTPAGGTISFRVAELVNQEKPWLRIEVEDSGAGISPDQLPYIFDRFYRGENAAEKEKGLYTFHGKAGTRGFGIGLALTRELVRLSGGSIKASSERGKGAHFEVLLPVSRKAPASVQPDDWKAVKLPEGSISFEGSTDLPAAGNNRRAKATKPQLLIVEDHPDVVRYLISCLSDIYEIKVAENGQSGVEKALELVPDIIISDVMMPVMDGFALCDRLKNDEKTSHIPIVLLTAKADAASKIAGLRRGADVYLPKPFQREELLAHLSNLIEQRKKLQERYRNFSEASDTDDASLIIEDAFLLKVAAIIEEHMAQHYFDISWLAKEMAMSRVQLFRKIKALTGQSPSQFVRSVRLQKARELLTDTQFNISEIAYEVGFSTPTFFSRSFREVFGVSPTELREENKG